MHIKNLHHRHYVAAPVAALVLALALLSSYERGVPVFAAATGQTLTVREPVPFGTPAGIYGTFGEGSMMLFGDTLALSDGTVLFASRGFARIAMDERTSVVSFGGAVSVARSATRLTIAAITTPAVLRHGEALLLVPAGYQGTWETLPGDVQGMVVAGASMQTLPKDFVRESLETLRKAAPADQISDVHAGVIAPFQPGSMLLSDDARERAQEEWAQDLIATILQNASVGTSQTALITDEIMESLAGTDALMAHAHDLVSATAAEPGVLMRFLPFVEGPSERLITYVHPDLRAAAWIALDPATEQTAVQAPLLHWMLLTDTAPEQLPGTIRSRWAQFASGMIADGTDGPAFFEHSLPLIAAHLDRQRRQGYPERFMDGVELLTQLSAAAPEGVSLEPLEKLKREAALGLTDPVMEAEAASSSISAVSTSSAASSAEPLAAQAKAALEAQVRGILAKEGAVFSMQTALTAVSAREVQVAGIVFSSTTEEHVYAFSFDPQSQMISNIFKDGGELLYPLKLEAFVQWAAQ